MRGQFLGWIIGAGATLAAANADAMTMSTSHSDGQCRVLGGDKLPSEMSADICAAVKRAAAAKAPGVSYSAEVQVLSRSRLNASLVVNGRVLPLQNFAVMDRNLNGLAIQHFAEGLATEIAKAAGK
jgi:hypothetical protein